MCEIAILDPRRNSVSELKSVGMALYNRMHSSLGAVGIRDLDDAERFEFDVYKDTDPDPDELFSFIEDVKESGAIRLILHGRLATQGEVIDENAHPLRVDCERCDVDYVLHNGMVRQYEYARQQLEEKGHNYESNVDSEVIAHRFGEVPDDFTDEAMNKFKHEPAFILMNENRVFIRSRTYKLSEDGIMSRTSRSFGPTRDDDDYGAVLLSPTGVDE